MNKSDLVKKIRSSEHFSENEKSHLLTLLNSRKKYGLVWEERKEEAEKKVFNMHPIIQEVESRRIMDNYDGKLDNNDHIIIEGDNLHALQLLAYTHKNKIDLIYIDPPYNTGEKDFKFNDQYVDQEDTFKHSKWLSFMNKRLRAAKKLLSDTGVLVSHIDENEFPNLSILLAEIFGEQNNLGTIIWNKTNPKGDAKGVSVMHEYIICYAKNKEEFTNLEGILMRDKPNAVEILKKAKKLYKKLGKKEIPEEVAEVIKPFDYSDDIKEDFKVEYDLDLVNKEFQNWLKNQDFSGGEKAYKYIDEEGNVYRGVSMAWPNKKQAPEDYFIPLVHPETGKKCPVPKRGWRNPPSTMKKLLEEDRILFGEDETKQPERKYLLAEHMQENTPSIFEYGGSEDDFLESLGISFPYAKPADVAKYIIKSVHPDPHYILDFFAGTGPVLQATIELNEENDSNSKCILVTNNENGIADDCYYRNKINIQGSEEGPSDAQSIKKANLRYYKTDFIEKDLSISNKEKLVKYSTDLLCIKEECYSVNTNISTDKIKFFRGKNKFLVIIYDDREISNAINKIRQVDNDCNVYVFSPGTDPYSDEFFEVLDKVKLCAIPDSILRAFDQVLPYHDELSLDDEYEVEIPH